METLIITITNSAISSFNVYIPLICTGIVGKQNLSQ